MEKFGRKKSNTNPFSPLKDPALVSLAKNVGIVIDDIDIDVDIELVNNTVGEAIVSVPSCLPLDTSQCPVSPCTPVASIIHQLDPASEAVWTKVSRIGRGKHPKKMCCP